MKKRMAENASNAASVDEFNNALNSADSNNSNNSNNNNNNTLPTSTPLTKKPKSSRVKVGHKNTESINPKFIKSVADWVAYCDRGNVILGADGSLQVCADDGTMKLIPFQKGFDAIRGINMRSEILRKKSADHLAFLSQQRRIDLSRLQDQFVKKEGELLAATRAFRESVSGDADGSLAAEVVRINKELSNIHSEIQNAKYSFQTPVAYEPYFRYQINYASHDDRVIFLNQNINMETTALMRTLGLDGETLPEVEDADEEDEDEETNEENSEDNTEESEENLNLESTREEPATSVLDEAMKKQAVDPYFQELVDEIKTKLDTFTPTPDMTVGQLKAAIFTEERLAYYNAHIPDFKKQFGNAYIKATEKV